MAKKAVATFKSGTLKKMVKCIRMDKSPKTGAYVFTEELVEEDKAKDFLRKEIILSCTLYSGNIECSVLPLFLYTHPLFLYT